MGAALLVLGLGQEHPTLGSSFFTIEPSTTRSPAPQHWQETDLAIHDIHLSCDLSATDVPPSAGMVRFHLPPCPKLRLSKIRNETANVDGDVYLQANGARVSELIALNSGSNTFSFWIDSATEAKAVVARKPKTTEVSDGRQPASVNRDASVESVNGKTLLIFSQKRNVEPET